MMIIWEEIIKELIWENPDLASSHHLRLDLTGFWRNHFLEKETILHMETGTSKESNLALDYSL